MSGSPFSPWWYYEMGKTSAERSRQPQQKSAPTRTQRASLSIGLLVFWAFLTAMLSVLIYIIATIFGGLDFWLCLIISSFISFWFCSLVVC